MLRRIQAPRPRRQAIAYGVAVVGTVALAAGFVPFRDEIEPLTKGFGFVVVVVAAAGIGGIGPGILASILGFVVFNFYFLPPYGTFAIGKPEYVVVLFVFLGLSVLIVDPPGPVHRARGGRRGAGGRAPDPPGPLP